MIGRNSQWVTVSLIVLLIIVAAVVGYAFNFFVAAAIIVIGLALLISRMVQEAGPPKPED